MVGHERCVVVWPRPHPRTRGQNGPARPGGNSRFMTRMPSLRVDTSRVMTTQQLPPQFLTVLAAASIALVGACTMESDDPVLDEEVQATQPGSHAGSETIDAKADPAQLGSEAVVVL